MSNTKTYAILYDDQTYNTYDLTEDDYKQIEYCLLCVPEIRYAKVSIGLIGLTGIRSVIEQKPEAEDLDKGADPGYMTESEKEWIRNHRAAEEQYRLLEGEELVD